jgi:hypothetical protein
VGGRVEAGGQTPVHRLTGGMFSGHVDLAQGPVPAQGLESGEEPEEWAERSEELEADSNELDQFRVTGDRFAEEMIASNPSIAESFKNMNAADHGA